MGLTHPSIMSSILLLFLLSLGSTQLAAEVITENGNDTANAGRGVPKFQNENREECISRAEMEILAKSFSQFRELANKGDYCFDNSQTSHLLAGIMFMRKTEFSQSMPSSGDDLFSGRFKSPWYDYFIGRIDEFVVPSDCPKGVAAYVYGFGNTMYVCPMLLSANYTALDRASVFMHEARHIDGFPHVTCSSGARQGLSGACDRRISDGGSYAVTVETYAQISAYAPEIHPALRAYSRAAAITYADETFDVPTQVKREAKLLLMTEDRQFFSVDANLGQFSLLGAAPELGKIVMRAEHMILYPQDKTKFARYVFARGEGEISQAAGDIASEYNSQTSEERAKLVDAHIGAQWSARVFKTRIRLNCSPRSEATEDFVITNDHAENIVYPNGYSRARKSAVLQTVSGQYYEFGCDDGQGYLKPSGLIFDRRFQRILKIANVLVGLDANGSLYKIENGRSSVVALPGQTRIFEMAPFSQIEFIDSKD